MTDVGGDDATEGTGASEPITLTDPDGSITRVASWSSWTREQIRAPGGELLLVTRLDQGQLWFAAGRRRSPWHHQVEAGPVTVATPSGRFHVTAETDGGATVVCLAGRTRLVAGRREPVLLDPNQTASVSADGATLVVTDHPGVTSSPGIDGDGAGPAGTLGAAPDPGSTSTGAPMSDEPVPDEPAPDDEGEAVPLPAVAGGSNALTGPIAPGPARRSLRWLPELVAMAAVLAVLVASVVVLLRSPSGGTNVVAGPQTTEHVGRQVETTTAPSSTSVPSTSTTEAPAVTTTSEPPAVATTTRPPALLAPGTASGTLTACRRTDGGVRATVSVSHRSGGAGPFAVEVGLVDAAGQVFATGEDRTSSIEVGGTAPVEVLVPVDGKPRGACELLAVLGA